MRVVIGHDFMEAYGGAERIVAEMARIFPEAPVYAIAGRDSVARRMGVEDRFTSLLKPRRLLLKHYRLLTPAFPTIVDRLDLPEADVLLTSSYAFAHRLRTENRSPQVCYCYNPLRFAWSMKDHYRGTWAGGGLSARAFDVLAAGMRRSDRRASERVARYVTLSEYAAQQVRASYGREAEVIGPPVDTNLFRPSADKPDDYFLFCGRLIEPYKRPGIVVEAFRRMPDRRLVMAGDGPALDHLRAIAPDNVEFVGELGDQELVHAMQHCRATIFPSRDDFGLIPVEVAACGRPTLAFAGGGALETVVPGVTGEFMPEQTMEAVLDAVRAFDDAAYDRVAVRRHSERWSVDRFRERITRVVAETAALS